MLQENVVVEVETRVETGKNAANRLRAQDQIPAVLYGGGQGMETIALKVPRKALLSLFRKGLHENAIFQLKLKGTDQMRHAMVRDVTVGPLTRKLLHVDFVRVLLDRKMRIKVPVEVVGIPEGVKTGGGILDVVTREISIECLPADIPKSIQVDVSALNVHDSLRVSALTVDPKFKVLEHSDRVILHIAQPRVEEVAAAAAVPGAGEPEVVKKGKKDEA
ncbi:MAG: 50S ribosomal protein L25, partial [Acidobacteria bacterium]|nr:50S ribosomal protein L25 [Acidobacteriota bacterium]